MKYLIVVGGATATGKTALAIRLAQHLGTEILSADSRQFYREMNIGTNKPNAAELAAARHHFIDLLSVTDAFSVGDFEQAALPLLDSIFRQHDTAIITGGSGLYLKAVYEGLDRFPDISAATKQAVETAERTGGLHWLQTELARLDPAYFQVVDRQNPARLRRAIEVCTESGLPYSSFLQGKQKEERVQESPAQLEKEVNFQRSNSGVPHLFEHAPKKRPFHPIFILLDLPRSELYARIEARVDAMISAGLEAEARNLLPFRNRSALRTVGYEEWFDFFDGNISREEAIGKIKQHTRNYAKRQATWFRKHGNWRVFHPQDFDGILAYIQTCFDAGSAA
jgi:tRNA dimethylallyltransferase